jgi:hypothetical protein
MSRSSFATHIVLGLVLGALAGAAGCSSSSGATDGGGPDGSSHEASADTVAPSTGLFVEIRATAPLPITSNGASIATAALWIQRVEVDGDQGGYSQSRAEGIAFDAGQDVIIPLPAAPPGLYSLIRVTIAPADTGAGWPTGFGGQQLAARATGTVGGRSFEVDDDQNGSVDLHVTPAQLAPGGALTALIQIDVSSWLSGVALDNGTTTGPIVIGPSTSGNPLDGFTSNVLASLSGSLVAP